MIKVTLFFISGFVGHVGTGAQHADIIQTPPPRLSLTPWKSLYRKSANASLFHRSESALLNKLLSLLPYTPTQTAESCTVNKVRNVFSV